MADQCRYFPSHDCGFFSAMEQQKKEFTGVWIPRIVIEDKDLSSEEKILFADISSFNQCFKMNSTFAEQFGVSIPTIQRWLRKLKEKGYVIESGFDGRKRYLQGYQICNPRGIKNDTPGVSKVIPIDNNIDNNDIAEQSSENITTNSGSSPPLTEKSNLGGRTDFVVERIHEESGEPISPRKKPNTWEREKSVFATFAERCRTELGTEPEPAKIWQLKQIRNVLERYTEDQLADVFDEWFATANDEVILNIHSALSAQNLNRLKLKL